MAQELPPNPVLQEAMRLLRAGEPARAEEVAARAAREAKARFGPDSAAYAAAANDLGCVLLWAGQQQQALAAFRTACAVEFPGTGQETRDYLTRLMNLGTALEQAGELAEAEDVLRRGLEERRAFYGADHPGYAFGLEPLAQVLLRKGEFDAALGAVGETVDVFRRHGHPRLVTALALRAEALATAGRAGPVFADTDDLPDDLIGELADAVYQRVEGADPAVMCRVLEELVELVSHRLGETDEHTVGALSILANVEGARGGHAARERTIRRAIAAYEARGEPGMALQAVQGLALARSEAQDTAGAERAYREAVSRADALDDYRLRSQARRNYGLFLADQGRRPEAEEWLRAAVADGRGSGNAEMLGRARVALGIFLQHGQQFEEARGLLTEALRELNPAHPDAVIGRSHLRAIEDGGSCGCGDLRQAAAEAFRQFFLAQLPPGLVRDVRVTVAEDDCHVEVELEREPTPEEQQLLERTHRHAYQQFREQVGKRS